MHAQFRRVEPPLGWSHYFPNHEYAQDDRRVLLIVQLQPYLRSEEAWDVFLSRIALVGANKDKTVLSLSFARFVHACGAKDVLEAVSMQPSIALACISLAVHEVSPIMP